MPDASSKIPLNRIIAFAGPYISILSGAIVNWVYVHLHFLSGFHTQQSSITKWLSQALVFGLTTLIVWAGHQKWLTGWQKWENAIAGEIFNGPALPPPSPGEMGDYNPDVEPTPPDVPLSPPPPSSSQGGAAQI